MPPGGSSDVLYVTYDGLLEPLGASQVLPYVHGLARRGFSMAILSFEKPGDLARRGAVDDLAAELESGGVAWTRLRYHARPTLPATAWDVVAGRRVVARWARGRRTPTIVHARGYVPGLMGLAGRRSPAGKLLFDMRGFWVDERIEGGYWSPGGVEVAVGRRMEGALLRDADHLILLTRRAAHRLSELAGGAPVPPWTVVPTCVDLERFRATGSPAEARRELGIGEGPVLIHTGTVSGWYDGTATMRVGKTFVERTGGGFVVLTREREQARALAARVGAEPLVRSVSPREVPLWLTAADAGLALVRPSPAKDASFPTKVGEYLAAGLAVLATPVGDLPEMEDGRVLSLVDPAALDPDAAVAWLERAIAAPSRARDARALAEAHVGLEAGIERLAGVYGDLRVTPRPRVGRVS